jgi:hypothetical protein
MKKLILFFLAMPFLAMAEPPKIIRVEKTVERLHGVAYDYYYDVVATDSMDNTYRYLLPPTFTGKAGDVVIETSPVDVSVNGRAYVNYIREYFFKLQNRKNL